MKRARPVRGPWSKRGDLPPLNLEACWGARREPPEHLARRTVAMFRRLRRIHPGFTGWYDRNRDRDMCDFGTVLGMAERGRQRRDDQPSVPLEEGWSMFGAWNAEIRVSVSAGMAAAVLPNHIMFMWTPSCFVLRSYRVAVGMVRAAVSAWDPDFCTVASGSHEMKIPGVHHDNVRRDMWTPEVGWIVYLRRRRLTRRHVPSAWRVEQLGRGTLITTRRTAVDIAKRADYALVEQIRQEMGLFPPYWIDDWPHRRTEKKTMAGYSGTPLAKKLGIRPGFRVGLVNAPDGFEDLLEGLPGEVAPKRGWPRGEADVFVIFVAAMKDLEKQIARAIGKLSLEKGAGIWVAWPKKASGVKTDVTEDVVRAVALPLGVVDNKVCAIDETWSGLRLVRRIA